MLELVKRLTQTGGTFRKASPADVRAMRQGLVGVLAAHPYFDFVEHFGIFEAPRYAFLAPHDVLAARVYQQEFFEGASFGDAPEDEANLAQEQAFRCTLVPFQYAASRRDYFCLATANTTKAGPLIIDIYHDDFELVSNGDALSNPLRATVYTRDFAQHLAWVADLLAGTADKYPPL